LDALWLVLHVLDVLVLLLVLPLKARSPHLRLLARNIRLEWPLCPTRIAWLLVRMHDWARMWMLWRHVLSLRYAMIASLAHLLK
jgi:hypothetical protein